MDDKVKGVILDIILMGGDADTNADVGAILGTICDTKT
jgi:hypothetical protein